LASELRDEDKNTKYFHYKVDSKRRRNTIKCLEDEDGKWVDSEKELEQVVVRYFSDLFSSSNPSIFDTALEGVEQELLKN